MLYPVDDHNFNPNRGGSFLGYHGGSILGCHYQICRSHGISDATYYNWKSKYGGMSASDLKRLKEMERELSQLKRMYADMAMENRALKDLIEKKL